jgi:hypothetical protein
MVPLLVSFYQLVRKGENVGVERAVTRWYAQRQLLSEEIVRLEAKLAPPPDANDEAVDLQPLQEELVKAQEKLRLLGSCPQPMMG